MLINHYYDLEQRILESAKYILNFAQRHIDQMTADLLSYLHGQANLGALASLLRYHAGRLTQIGHTQAQSYWCWIDAAFFYLEATNSHYMSLNQKQQNLIFAAEELEVVECLIAGGSNAYPRL